MAGKSSRTPSGTPATSRLGEAGVAYVLHPYEHDSRSSAYGDEAVAALGIDPHRLLKTLVVTVDTSLACAVVPVAFQLDLKGFAAALGGKRAALAQPAAAARATGYVVGGISPIGQRTRLRTLIDESAATFDTVYVSAGKRGLQVELAPDDLMAVTGAAYAALGRIC